jgi:hypothetical protein
VYGIPVFLWRASKWVILDPKKPNNGNQNRSFTGEWQTWIYFLLREAVDSTFRRLWGPNGRIRGWWRNQQEPQHISCTIKNDRYWLSYGSPECPLTILGHLFWSTVPEWIHQKFDVESSVRLGRMIFLDCIYNILDSRVVPNKIWERLTDQEPDSEYSLTFWTALLSWNKFSRITNGFPRTSHVRVYPKFPQGVAWRRQW